MIVNNVNPTKLLDELMNAGIVPILVTNDRQDGQKVAENTWITFDDDTDMTAVQAVIDAHNPEPLPPPVTDLEKFKLEQAQADAELFEMMLMLTGGVF